MNRRGLFRSLLGLPAALVAASKAAPAKAASPVHLSGLEAWIPASANWAGEPMLAKAMTDMGNTVAQQIYRGPFDYDHLLLSPERAAEVLKEPYYTEDEDDDRAFACCKECG